MDKQCINYKLKLTRRDKKMNIKEQQLTPEAFRQNKYRRMIKKANPDDPKYQEALKKFK